MAHKKGVGSSRNGRDSNPQYLGVTSRNSGDGATWYDSMQAKVERRFGGWQMMTSYTYSKSLAKLHYRQIFTQSQSFPQNSYDLDAEKSLSWFDLPHTLNLLNSYDLPFGSGVIGHERCFSMSRVMSSFEASPTRGGSVVISNS